MDVPARLLPVLPAAALLAACAGSGSMPDPTAKHLEYAERAGYPATLTSLKTGRRLYLNRCANCHTLHRPAAFPASHWPVIVQDMAANAEINEDQVRDITRYLVAVASAAEDSGPPRPMGSPDSGESAGRPEPERSPGPAAPPGPATP